MLARTMKMTLVALALGVGLGVTVPTFAETLAIDGQVTIKPATVETPQRGSTMAVVEKKFGAPANKSSGSSPPSQSCRVMILMSPNGSPCRTISGACMRA